MPSKESTQDRGASSTSLSPLAYRAKRVFRFTLLLVRSASPVYSMT